VGSNFVSYNSPPKFESNFFISKKQRNSSSNTDTDFVKHIQNIGTIWVVVHPQEALQCRRMEALCSTPVAWVGVISDYLATRFSHFMSSSALYCIRNTIRPVGTPFCGGFSSNRERPGRLNGEAISWAITHHLNLSQISAFPNSKETHPPTPVRILWSKSKILALFEL
jgi:hypothetical protein